MGLASVWRQVRQVLFPERKGVRSFEHEVQAAGGVVGRVDAGMRIVPAAKVVGSVGRWQNLASNFFYKTGRAITQRHLRIGKAMEQGKVLPPIEVYKVKMPRQQAKQEPAATEYYVVDGHHRVAMAKKLGQDFLDAHVVEYKVAGTGPTPDAAARGE